MSEASETRKHVAREKRLGRKSSVLMPRKRVSVEEDHFRPLHSDGQTCDLEHVSSFVRTPTGGRRCPDGKSSCAQHGGSLESSEREPGRGTLADTGISRPKPVSTPATHQAAPARARDATTYQGNTSTQSPRKQAPVPSTTLHDTSDSHAADSSRQSQGQVTPRAPTRNGEEVESHTHTKTRALSRGSIVSARLEVDDNDLGGKVLAETSAVKLIEFDGKDGVRLNMNLQVQTCPFRYNTRLRYHASFFLTPSATQQQQEIGFVDAWRVSKPSLVQPNIDRYGWVNEWLKPSLESYDSEVRPLVTALRALYTSDGQFGPEEGPALGCPPNMDTILSDHGYTIMYIQNVYIKWNSDIRVSFAGKSLLKHVLGMFYASLGLGKLPSWYSLSGNVVFLLEPRMPVAARLAEPWEATRPIPDETEQEMNRRVRKALQNIFQWHSIGYRSYVCDRRVESDDSCDGIIIMGKELSMANTVPDCVDVKDVQYVGKWNTPPPGNLRPSPSPSPSQPLSRLSQHTTITPAKGQGARPSVTPVKSRELIDGLAGEEN